MDRASSRLRVLALLVALMFVALSTRLWFLQVLATDRFEKDARSNSVRIVATDPLRGKIYDDHNRVLVGNHASIVVRVNRAELGAQPEAVERQLASLLGIKVDELRTKLRTKLYYAYQPIPVAVYTDTKVPRGQKMPTGQAVEAAISEHPEEYPGVDVVHTSVRSYPHTRLAAQILGYLGPIDQHEYEQLKDKGYGLSDQIGRAGLEQVYESYLRGEPGKQKYIVNSDGDTLRVLGGIPATPGDDLRLTLDVPSQRAVEQELQRGLIQARTLKDSNGQPLKANAAAVVVMDAHTGGITAMASLPSYDPTWWVNGPTKAQRAYLNSPNYTPMIDRAMQLPYIPGSTFKPITGLAAVKEGFASLSPGSYYYCSGAYTSPGDLSGTEFHNWTSANLGYMSLAEALRISCDTVFYRLGTPFWAHYAENQGSPDAELLQRDLREWGFGAPTGIDLPAEASGLVPDAAWAEANPKIFPFGPVPGLDIRTMIGSTYVTATPLQMAEAYAAIANGGHLCRPHVVASVRAPNGSVVKGPDAKCDRTLPYTPTQLTYIRNALASVVTSGTAACPFEGFPLSQVAVAGKTGTAERPPHQDTSWFVAMVGKPGQEPDYVVATMVEQGGFGSQVAAPITRAIIERLSGLGETPHPGCALMGDR
jgi:penicillin-binding protein 2